VYKVQASSYNSNAEQRVQVAYSQSAAYKLCIDDVTVVVNKWLCCGQVVHFIKYRWVCIVLLLRSRL